MGWAAKKRTGRPAGGAGQHPQGRNAEEVSAPARVAARRGGPKGERRPPHRRGELQTTRSGRRSPVPISAAQRMSDPPTGPPIGAEPSRRAASRRQRKRRPRNGATQRPAWRRAEQRPRSLRRRRSPAGRRERETAARPARREARAPAGQHESVAPSGARSAGQSASLDPSRSFNRLWRCAMLIVTRQGRNPSGVRSERSGDRAAVPPGGANPTL